MIEEVLLSTFKIRGTAFESLRHQIDDVDGREKGQR
jgi:hypothetical protein